MIATKPFTELDLLKKQLAEETKEKYALYKRIKELNEELRALKNKSPELSSDSGPNEIQRNRT
jgi:predicted nuclease with TOPRIM domain|tara:strand:- start:37 stop:225 length:189 start_codon:yes stop_codon:yes gene_type:complete